MTEYWHGLDPVAVIDIPEKWPWDKPKKGKTVKRICSKCKLPILKAHRWRFVHRKFLFWTFTKTEHRDCARPTEIHKHVIRLKGEVPLPFDGPIPVYEPNAKDEEFTDEQVAYMIRKGIN